MSTAALPPERRRHASAVAHLAAALIVLLVVLLVALRAQPQTPPPIAAFAPQVNQVIKQAPSNQSGTTGGGGGTGRGQGPGPGTGNGGGAGGGGAATPSPAPTGTFYNCYRGNPPRQIADPQSPPCVPNWSGGDNGGATSPGVTRDTIDIAVPNQDGSNYNNDIEYAAAQSYVTFFNKNFNFYGRKLVLHEVAEISNSAADQATLANTVAALPAFASTQFTDEGGWTYATTLASKHVIASTGFEENPSEAQLQSYDPYLWSYEMSSDNMLATMGNWYCAELNGHVAAHAGTQFQNSQRVLGVVVAPWDYNSYPSSGLTPLTDSLSRCGVKPMVITDSTENWGNADVAFHTANPPVTSVMCICNFEYWSDMATYANGQGYFPEWLLSSYGGTDANWSFHFGNASPAEARDAFGLTFAPRQEALQNDPFWWAWSEGGGGNSAPRTIIDIYQVHLLYRSMLEIAAGIQMAGPHLTPQTFAEGLHRTSFPDPVTPLNAGFVDFFGGSHAMTVDAAEWWYSPTAPSPYASFGDGSGAICYVDGGRRHSINGWAGATDRFDSGGCDTGA
jgi:hypothetical protein